MNQWDYLIVGAGLYGSMMAYRLRNQGKKCLVIDKRGHLGGNRFEHEEYDDPQEWHEGLEPYYPVNDVNNMELYARYKALADKEEDVVFGGRLAEYKYYDMAPIVERVLNM